MKYKINATEYEALPDAQKSLYGKASDGSFVLQIEGLETVSAEEKARLKEFRDNNISLKRQLDEMNKKVETYKDIDPVKYAEYAEQSKKLKELEEQNLIKAGDLDKVIGQRTETMRQDYQRQLTALQTKAEADAKANARYRDQYKQLKVDTAVTSAVSKVGALRPGAEVHIRNLARSIWDLDEEDNLIGKDLYSDDGKTPMQPEEWGKRLLTDHPYLFEAAQGGGAQGGNKGGGSSRSQGAKVLNRPNPVEFGKSLEDIASGKVEVQM